MGPSPRGSSSPKPLEGLWALPRVNALVAVQNDIQQLGEDAASQKRVNPVERQVEAIERMFDISLISHVTTFIVEQDVALGYPVAARKSRLQRSNNQSRCF